MVKRLEQLISSDCADIPALLDALPMGIALLDGQGNICMLNKALEALTGFSRDDVRGLPCRHVLRSKA
ncbi:MAG: PAS domain S-box protein [Desulfovibrionales bacterium]|nr:PAS domain S-box protein [Desulfovibrionales bacterium]